MMNLVPAGFAVLLVLGTVVTEAHAVPLGSEAVPHSAPVAPPPTVSFGVWAGALTELLDSTPAPAVAQEYRDFIALHRLPGDNPQLLQDYRRLRLLFEATRDGGFWHLRWDITDQYPSSRLIWKQWTQKPVQGAFAEPSATAECDELSALLGMLARHAKIDNVGLYYPTWNHTISVWAPLAGKAKVGLIQLPTTQIFLGCSAGFDQTTFRTSLKNIERYPNRDLNAAHPLPQARADWLLHQLSTYAAASPTLWSLMRAKRAFALRSSMGACQEARAEWHQQLKGNLTEGDVDALAALAKEELERPELNATETLAWLLE